VENKIHEDKNPRFLKLTLTLLRCCSEKLVRLVVLETIKAEEKIVVAIEIEEKESAILFVRSLARSTSQV
jgi:hypothetical protein